MTDFSNLIDWAKRVYPIENYDNYESWESDVVEDLESNGHMPKKTDNLFDQLEKYWKGHKKEKPKRADKDITDFSESELPSKNPINELPRNTQSELPEQKPIAEPPTLPKKKPRVQQEPPIPKEKPKPKPKSIVERFKGGISRLFRRKKK